MEDLYLQCQIVYLQFYNLNRTSLKLKALL